MGAFDISYNDIAGAPLGSGKKKVAPIQAAQGIAAPTAALSTPQVIDAQKSIIQAPAVQQSAPAQSITQGAESYMRAHQPGDAVAISYPPIMPDATTSPRPVPVMPTPPGIAKSMSGGAGQQPAPATIADIRTPNTQAQPMRSQPVVRQPSVQAAPAQAQTVDDGYGGVYTPGGGAIAPDKAGSGILAGAANFFKDSAEAARSGVHYDQVRANRLAGEASTATPAPQPASSATANPANFKAQDPFGPKPEAMGVGKSADGQFITGKNGATPDSSGGGFTDKNGVSYSVNTTSQDGIAKVTASGKNPLYTNIKPEDAVSGLKNQMVGGDAASVQQGLDRLARANAIRQEMIDSQPSGGIAIMSDGGVEAANAEKTARWRQDDLIAKAARNPAAGQVALASANGQNAMGVEEMRQQGDAARNAVAMRGQDIALARSDGSPEERQLKQAQAQGIMAQTESSKMLADLQKKALAGDAQAAASYRALTGKSGADYKDRYITLPNRKVYNEMGQVVGEESGGIFDAATGRPVQADGAKQGAAKAQSAPASAVDYLKKNPAQAEAFKAKYGYLPEGF